MQVQKDEIKNKIIDAALEEFLINGYAQSSMRNIASQAGITVGNIYSYYSSKDILFESILANTISQFNDLIFMEIDSLNSASIKEMTHNITKVFMQNKAQFLILINGSAGSKYENIKADLIELAFQRIEKELNTKFQTNENSKLIYESIAVAVIEGVINIFIKCDYNEKKLSQIISEFLNFIFGEAFNKKTLERND